ncbi:MAG: hypothetical protein JWM47_1872 [Acidimicrobiales bacterium]|nr:hypothetical protein [Acidimicrobiales bacterium]
MEEGLGEGQSAAGLREEAGGRRFARFRRTRAWRWGRWPLAGAAALGLVAVVGFAYLYATVSLPDESPQIRSSVVLDAKGRRLAVLQKDERRVEVDLADVAPIVAKALVAAEDRNFYGHNGIDPRGLVRALRNNASGGSTQGGSTITQQLVKNLYLGQERTYRRKVREAVLAIKLDRQEDKDKILERYLNTVYFGRGTYGIQAAAEVYFKSSANLLTPPQAALLIGLLRAPESAEPDRDPELAKRRRNGVLDDLVEVGDLTEREAEEFKRTPLGTQPRASTVTLATGVGAHVVEWVREEAIERFGPEAVYGGGLVIRSTIDIDDQRAAEEAVAAVLTAPDDPQAALVAVDGDGAVRAHVGGQDFAKLQVDLARGRAGGGSGRQAGSAFKPIVLASALDGGKVTLASRYPAPAEITLDAGGEPWTVGNYGGSGFGVVDLTEATANSVNTTYAQLMLDIGPERAVETARRLGIEAKLRPDPSLVLGTGEVSVVDMASAYSTFARRGEHIDPYVIAAVEDPDGRVLFEVETPERQRAVPAEVADGVSHALQRVVEDGTGTAAKLDRPAAGKTGTTQDNGDAWFTGYTPNYTAAVWMGYPEGPDRPMDAVHGKPVTGGSLPAEIWRRFMEKALEDVEPADFEPPPDAMLQPPELPEATLELTPAAGAPGTTLTASGTGYEECFVDWFVRLDPGGARTPPDSGRREDERRATLVVPADLAGGDATATAFCDRGAGPEAMAGAVFRVEGPVEETTTSTTSSSTSTTTTTTGPPATAPVTAPTLVPVPPPPTTTTTRPPD